MKKKLDPDCYGAFPNIEKKCVECQYRESCKYYTTAKKEPALGYDYSLDALESLQGVSLYIDSEKRERKFSSQLTTFFQYLLDLDDYSLGILLEIMRPHDGLPQTVNSLAATHGCTRQAMHEKIISIIARHPELASLFRGVLVKLPAARWRFFFDRSRRK